MVKQLLEDSPSRDSPPRKPVLNNPLCKDMYESLRLRNNDVLVIKVVHETYLKPQYSNLNGTFRDNR